MIVKLGIFPKVRGENKKYLKPPPSFIMFLVISQSCVSQMLRVISPKIISQFWHSEQPQIHRQRQMEGHHGGMTPPTAFAAGWYRTSFSSSSSPSPRPFHRFSHRSCRKCQKNDPTKIYLKLLCVFFVSFVGTL